jgi:DNA-binding transcriptional ArsR family regulator
MRQIPTQDRGTPGRRAVCDVPCVDGPKVARARAALPPPETVATLADTFRALGDPTRLRLVAALAREELCVCDLSTLLGVTQSAVSHSLRTLRELRLVRYRRAGKIAYYALDDAHIVTLLALGVRHVEEARRTARVAATA